MGALDTIHFLHIRKTGGMAFKAALAPVAEEFGLKLHWHRTRLVDIPAAQRIVFVVRDPVSRFVSGFNSRLRMGRPLLDRPWNEDEAQVFAAFKHAGALAEALAAEDARAIWAMGVLRHVNLPMSHWIGSEEMVRNRLPEIVWIGTTETLGDDFEEIKRRLGLPASLRLPQDATVSHRTPAGMDTALSERGRQAIERWYAGDAALFAFLRRTRESLHRSQHHSGIA